MDTLLHFCGRRNKKREEKEIKEEEWRGEEKRGVAKIYVLEFEFSSWQQLLHTFYIKIGLVRYNFYKHSL
jgi:hypothetical protein